MEKDDAVAPAEARGAADTMQIEIGDEHQPSEETIAAAEALKTEGNELLRGEWLSTAIKEVGFVFICFRIA